MVHDKCYTEGDWTMICYIDGDWSAICKIDWLLIYLQAAAEEGTEGHDEL